MFYRRDLKQAAVTELSGARYVRTLGSMDEPLLWVRSSKDLDQEAGLWQRALEALGIVPGMRMVVALPNSDMAHAAARGAERLSAATLVVPEYDLFTAITAVHPDAMMTTPMTAFRLILRQALDDVRVLVLTGDVGGHGALRERLAEEYPDLTVREVYALTEYPGPLARECAQGRLHWESDAVAVEFIRPATGTEAQASQVGSVVVTDMEERALPLLRYNTEDAVRVADGPCPCGGPGVTSHEILGRLSRIRVVSGRVIYPADLAEVIFSVPGVSDRFRASVRTDRAFGRDQVDLVVGLLPGIDPKRVMRTVVERVLDRIGIVPEVTVKDSSQAEMVSQIFIQEYRAQAPDPGPYLP